MTAHVMPLVALFQVFDGLGVVTGGILRAKGQQNVGAVLNLAGYYIIGIPVGLVLAFHASMGIYGLWTGLTIALVLIAAFGVWSESVVLFLLAESPDSVVYSSLHGH
jgi:MATE family multidrug resistance protein